MPSLSCRGVHGLLVSLCLLALGAAAVGGATPKSRAPLIIADGNWTQTLEGEWLIEFMAPWCPACRAFTAAWAEVAGWAPDLGLAGVATIDVTANPGLSGRFLVTSLPTIYHVHDGEFRLYSGPRRTDELLTLVQEAGWKATEPLPWYRSPKSLQMGVVGAFFKAAMFIRQVYSTLTEVYGLPEWACYLGFAALTIITGLLLGLLLVVCCDNFFPAKYIPLPPAPLAAPAHPPSDDTDIIDDTEERAAKQREEEEAQAAAESPDDGGDGTGGGDADTVTPAAAAEGVRRRAARRDS